MLMPRFLNFENASRKEQASFVHPAYHLWDRSRAQLLTTKIFQTYAFTIGVSRLEAGAVVPSLTICFSPVGVISNRDRILSRTNGIHNTSF
jgi:hypothetical protein